MYDYIVRLPFDLDGKEYNRGDRLSGAVARAVEHEHAHLQARVVRVPAAQAPSSQSYPTEAQSSAPASASAPAAAPEKA